MQQQIAICRQIRYMIGNTKRSNQNRFWHLVKDKTLACRLQKYIL